MDPIPALVTAVQRSDLDAAAALLRDHADLRTRINDPLPGLAFDGTILQPAVRHQSRAMIDLLLAHGADINTKTRWWAGGFDLLDMAAPELVPFLLERGARFTANSAARLGRFDELERLLDANPALVHARGGDGQTPLHVAANVTVAELLLGRGADVNATDVDHESTPAQYAIGERRDVARFLIDRGSRSDILLAAALGDLELARRHLDADPRAARVTVSSRDFPMRNKRAGGIIYIWTLGAKKSPHAVARASGHEAVYELLMSRSPDVIQVAVACETGDRATLDACTAARAIDAASLADDERVRLVDAAETDNPEAVRLLLGAGWPADTRGEGGESALHWAAWNGNVELVRDILSHAAPLDLRDARYGGTPLDWAMHAAEHGDCGRGNHAAVIELLRTAGAPT